ncbi:hypothetical protein ABPG75_011556 [Micractinium tetrahymenae]
MPPGLLHTLRGAARGCDGSAGVGMGAELFGLLASSCLQPIAGYNERKHSLWMKYPDGSEDSQFSPCTPLQLLVAGVLMKVQGDTDDALKYLSRGLCLLWDPSAPPAMALGARLAAAHWVPCYPPGGASSGADAAAEQQQQQQQQGRQRSQQEGQEGQWEQALQPATLLARAVAAGLAQHCPSVRFADLLRWAHMLRLWAGGAAQPTPMHMVLQQHLLCDAQAVLDSPAPGSRPAAAMWATQLVLLSTSWAGMGAAQASALERLFEAAIEAGEREQCWLVMVQTALSYASWSVDHQAAVQQRPAAQRSAQRPRLTSMPAWLLARLRQLAQRAQHGLDEIKAGRLVPRPMRKDMENGLKGLQHDIGVAARGGVLTASANPSTFHMPDTPACACCGDRALVLLKCSACKAVEYCSKDCQRKHWREAHKAECGRLTAAR